MKRSNSNVHGDGSASRLRPSGVREEFRAELPGSGCGGPGQRDQVMRSKPSVIHLLKSARSHPSAEALRLALAGTFMGDLALGLRRRAWQTQCQVLIASLS
jgi:hypothetical protein